MIHGDADGEVCILYCFLRQTFALCSHDNGQTFLLFQNRVGEGNALVGECHSSRTETNVTELTISVEPRPWYKKHSTHRNAY